MRDQAKQQAHDALDAIDMYARLEVLRLLASSRPEAVLQALDDLKRHRAVVASLIAGQAPRS